MTKEVFKEELFSKLSAGIKGLAPQEANGIGALIADNAAAALGDKMQLTREQERILKIVLEIAVLNLNERIIEGLGFELLDQASLSRQLGTVSEVIQMRLEEDLDPGQIAEINAFFDQLASDVAVMIREALFDHLSRFLALTPEQIEQFRPIFSEELEKWNLLINRFISNYKMLASDFVVRKKETRQRLEGLLSPGQLDSLAERQGAFGELIRLVLSQDN